MPRSVFLARDHRAAILAAADRRGVSAVRVAYDPADGDDAPLRLLGDFDAAGRSGLEFFAFADDVESLLGCPVEFGTGVRAGAPLVAEAL